MVVPRGLKTFLTGSSPGKLVRGKVAHFRAVDSDGKTRGPPLRGITKRLSEALYSNGEFAEGVFKGEWRGGAWQGDGGGIRRGKAVDAQVSRLAGFSKQKRQSSNKFKLSRMLFSILEEAGIEPLCGQRVVIDEAKRLGTAADVVGYRLSDKKVVVVELKSGYNGDRSSPALSKGKPCYFASSAARAKDTVLNRHFSQLAATLSMFVSERTTMRVLKEKYAVQGVEGCVVYVNDVDSQLFRLPRWWEKRGRGILDALR
tara:strand:+ start:739 stop:1512 length:774 start_codon:yes stop_codon:yes gene_type:complete